MPTVLFSKTLQLLSLIGPTESMFFSCSLHYNIMVLPQTSHYEQFYFQNVLFEYMIVEVV